MKWPWLAASPAPQLGPTAGPEVRQAPVLSKCVLGKGGGFAGGSSGGSSGVDVRVGRSRAGFEGGAVRGTETANYLKGF